MKNVIFTILLLHQLFVSGQSEIGLNVNYSRLDAFHGVEYTHTFNRYSIHVGIDVGVNRTYLQKRFFPKLKTGFSYAAVYKEKFKLQPIIQYSYAPLLFDRENWTFAHYHELSTGIRWRYGKKWKIGQTLLIGTLWDRSYNTLYLNSKTATTLAYTAQIDFSYAF